MKELNTFQQYFAEEFYDDYREGLITRREFIRRMFYITGSIASAIALMGLLGCTTSELPAPTEPVPPPALSQLLPVPDARSPFSVPEGDPAVIASDVAFASEGDQIKAYFARPVTDGVYAALLVCHENRGLNPHIEDVARRFAKAGYVTLAPDLLSRDGGTAAVNRDQVPGLLRRVGRAGCGGTTVMVGVSPRESIQRPRKSCS